MDIFQFFKNKKNVFQFLTNLFVCYVRLAIGYTKKMVQKYSHYKILN